MRRFAARRAALAGCGLNVQSPDLFVLSRTGQGKPLTLLVNDGGTIRCDGGKAKSLPDPLLLDARDLADDLDKDARKQTAAPTRRRQQRVHLQSHAPGRDVSFSDTAARDAPELARAELFAVPGRPGPLRLSLRRGP